jgi:hypothetical protein
MHARKHIRVEAIVARMHERMHERVRAGVNHNHIHHHRTRRPYARAQPADCARCRFFPSLTARMRSRSVHANACLDASMHARVHAVERSEHPSWRRRRRALGRVRSRNQALVCTRRASSRPHGHTSARPHVFADTSRARVPPPVVPRQLANIFTHAS